MERRTNDKFHEDISRELGGIHQQMKGVVEEMKNIVEQQKIANHRTGKLEIRADNLEAWQETIGPITEGLTFVQTLKKFTKWLGVGLLVALAWVLAQLKNWI